MNLWERMSHIYGHKWSSSMGESAIANGALSDVAQTWATGLNGVTGEQLAAGLHACINRNEPWPPTLPEFRALCKPPMVENAAMYRRSELLALPRPPRDYSKARPFLQTMQGVLKDK